ncbi:ATP-dependent Clp protease adaptor protein ClpS [Orbus hercynius]|uniref:ATP-dependent Clp protease adapter protein ClpS n=1 Tax=Orbus hercynius TaxID=593135 RepID=A0A495RKB7_9GAMM|nr:ATP-dependent Clp protease adapter ClpS [Orbus hercynius]RKS87799.1 ATP-dependent Clp protease adaptor protein ClpS [Orbus hercynius]
MSQQSVFEKLKVKHITPPAQYRVILHNDDYTTMDFVIDVLMRFFGHDENQATQIMFAVHQQGKGVCGIYCAEIAETKVFQVTQYAKEHQFPLKCTMEKVSS